ncbi:translation initiation factor IF-2 [Bacteroidia bacterium]|nr:translation initiation factor IF-2 [Bacteroidia bacterium]GHT80787.1 translation initiation factor IF-2 [Bacteroidia bacterium]
MGEEKTIRLNKVMKEFNLGFATVADYLAGKGIDVANPNDKISEDTYQFIAKDFGNDLLAAQQAKNVGIKKLKDVTVTPEPVVAKKNAAVKEVTIKDVTAEVFKAETKVQLPKIVGKINLQDEKEAKKQKSKAEKNKKDAEDAVKIEALKSLGKKASKTKKEAPVAVPEEVETVSPTLDRPKIVGSINLDEIDSDTKPKKKPVGQKTKIAEKSTIVDKPLTKKEKAEKEAAIKAAAKEKFDKEIGTKSKKEKEAVEVVAAPKPRAEEFMPTVVDVLSAPKIVSKIDLSQIKDNKPDTPVRGKRKRIKGGVVDINKESKNYRHDKHDKKKDTVTTTKSSSRGGNKRHAAISEEDVDKQMKETLAKMMEKGSKTKTSKYRREKRDLVSEKLQAEREQQDIEVKNLELTEFVTANDLSRLMDVSVNKVIDACMNLGLMVSINQRLDAEAIALIVENFGYKASFVTADTQNILEDEEDKPEDLQPRAPIVTVMGHVDHGKTSLIDNIRKTNVIAGEAGGITQHIGAYNVVLPNDRRITFLDTPGHEAFTAMRARGAQATDVAIIIIAADDSVMPQTVEAINHAVAAGVPMVFAINKIDKPGASPDKIREQLSAMNYLVEDWGGKYQVQEIAAKSGVNVDKLLEKVLVETDLLDLKANPNRKAKGVVIESLLEKGRGYISRMLVQTGTLHNGDVILCGQHVGKVKAMFNERSKKITEAGPSIPVEILGLNGATTAGDTFNVMADEREARNIASQREQMQRIQGLRTQKHITLDEIGRRIAIGNFKELNIIVKADVDGSSEALTDSLLKLSTDQVQVNVIHKAVGAISESDVQLAIAAEAIIMCFQVRPSSSVRKMAEQEGIDIRSYSIIYDAINEIKDAIKGMRAPEYKEEITCTVEILQVYHISKVGTVAGCIVREGKITRHAKVRVIRDGIVVYTGELGSLKRFKDDVKEVGTGFECGLNILNYNDVKENDVIEGYEMVEVK